MFKVQKRSAKAPCWNFYLFEGRHPISVTEVKTQACLCPSATLLPSAALSGLLAVPKSFQSKCKFHQPPTKKSYISIKAGVVWTCCSQ